MARYFLIDVDNMKNVANPKEVIDSLNALGVLLSPEETEAKWREVWSNGFNSKNKFNEYDLDDLFEKFKQSL